MTDISDLRADQPAWRQRAVMRSLGAAHSCLPSNRSTNSLGAAFELIDERGAADFTILVGSANPVTNRSGASTSTGQIGSDGPDFRLLTRIGTQRASVW